MVILICREPTVLNLLTIGLEPRLKMLQIGVERRKNR